MVEGISYDSFGNSTASSLTRYTYTGREFDSDTDLYYNRARWYDPQVGRFISEDPIGLHGRLNAALPPHSAVRLCLTVTYLNLAEAMPPDEAQPHK